MKLYLYFFMGLMFVQCSHENAAETTNNSNQPITEMVIDEANKACKSTNPAQTLLWLKEIVVKAEEENFDEIYGQLFGQKHRH